MSDDNNGEGIAVLIGLGILAVVGIGVLKVLASIAQYEQGEIITADQAAALPTYDGNEPIYGQCNQHGYVELCQYHDRNHCMECGGGLEHGHWRWCSDCDSEEWYDWNWHNNNDNDD